jgi:hypothetical protein
MVTLKKKRKRHHVATLFSLGRVRPPSSLWHQYFSITQSFKIVKNTEEKQKINMQQRRQKYEPTKEGTMQNNTTSPMIAEEMTPKEANTPKARRDEISKQGAKESMTQLQRKAKLTQR